MAKYYNFWFFNDDSSSTVSSSSFSSSFSVDEETKLNKMKTNPDSPKQVLTHAARAAAKQPPLVAARCAREGLKLEQNPEIEVLK